MSTRQVRFSDEVNETHTAEGTPSPSFSSTTLSSSPGPSTPPVVASILRTSRKMVIHEVLRLSSTPGLDYDLSIDPAIALAGSRVLTERVRGEPASTPKMAEIFLLSSKIPWKISIRASEGRDFVTVSDVLGGLYRALRIQVLTAELHWESAESRRDIHEAFKRRCAEMARLDNRRGQQERQTGYRRIDFFKGHHSFLGVFHSQDHPNEQNVWRFSVR